MHLCHLSSILRGFMIEPATLQALSADCLSLITWRDIGTEALEACLQEQGLLARAGRLPVRRVAGPDPA
jgi:hypothetical protein